ncbi:MAG: cls [Panacagrimonas sp.]|nr:cardiolipin synthase [Panacagrimonas sp.]MCC2659088.1 cls [Panacagrimonas sp.]
MSERVQHDIDHLYGTGDPQFERSMGGFLGPAIVEGNRVTPYDNGDQIFPALLDAIRGARVSINFETFIYWSGDIGRRVADALAERSRAGVPVHVLIDWLGSDRIDDAVLEVLDQAGVEVQRYHPLRWYSIHRLNNRTHRKLLIVDGRVGFTGGVGIADEWTGHAQDPSHWRDTHYRVEGPVVAQMQAVFLANWTKVSGKVLHGEAYFPELEPAGPVRAQVFSSSPANGADGMRLMVLMAITAAERSIRLAGAYFVPDERALGALVAARQRGVHVQVITPGPNVDARTVRWASRARWGALLQAGVEIHEYQPTMYHRKGLVIDERFVSVGSTNFDPRSFGLNDEANLNVYDVAFAEQQAASFDQDLRHARRVTYEEWKRRPLVSRVWESMASLLGPLL